MKRLLRSMGFCWVLTLALAPVWAEEIWPPKGFEPALISLRDGSRFFALVRAETPAQVQINGANQNLPWATLKAIKIGRRVDEEKDRQARVFIKDLESDQFDKRKAASEKLSALKETAIPALRDALKSADTETVERAKKLLEEIGHADVSFGDLIELREGPPLAGIFSTPSLSAVTRWKNLEFNRDEISEVKFTQDALAPELKKALVERLAAEPQAVAAPSTSLPMPELPVKTMDFESFNPLKDRITTEAVSWATFDRGADMRTKIKEGDKVNELYAKWGLKIGIPGSAQDVIASGTEPLKAKSGPLSCCVKEPPAQGDLEFTFWVPQPAGKTGDPVSGGVYALAFHVLGKNVGQNVVEFFDAEGRSVYKVSGDERHALGERRIEFYGLYSKIPIHTVRIMRAGTNNAAELRVDDISFSPVIAAAHDPRLALAEFKNGEKLWGLPGETKTPGSFALTPAFLKSKDEPPLFTIESLQRIACPRLEHLPAIPTGKDIPALIPELEEEHAPANAEEALLEKMVRPLHDILLQNGDSFAATLFRLDEKQVTLVLPGAVKLTLPRETLRKIDLRPKRLTEMINQQVAKIQNANPDPDEVFADGDDVDVDEEAKISVAETEKPGVEFRDKNAEHKAENADKNKGAAKPEEPKKPAGPNPAQGLPRMDNAEILKANFATGELVVDPKDGGGEWPIDLQAARYLVFAPLGDGKGVAGKPKQWTLVLRQGKRFDVNLKAVSVRSIKVEIAGGEAEFPFTSVAHVERKKD